MCLCLFASYGSAQSSSTTVEAETLKLTEGRGYPQNDSTASGGQLLKIWGNDTASKTVTLSEDADRITVRARGDQCRGAPHMLVKVNGKTVINQRVNTTTRTSYSANLSPAASGSTDVQVVFDNNYKRGGCDRNLYVDALYLSSSSTPTTGIYDGWRDSSGVNAFYDGLGYSGEEYAHEFVDHNYGWSTIGSGVWSGWKDWVAQDNANRRLTVSLPLLPTSSAGDFQGIVDGRYDAYYRQFAQGLKDTAAQDTIVRLGWEMNGNTFPWAVSSSNAETYKAAYRHAVDVMEAVEPSLEWEWEPNVTLDAARLPFEQIYPGDAHVDYIGLGMYNYHWPSGTADPGIDARWKWLQDPDPNRADDNGMIHHARFAAAQGKPITFTEWGLWPRGNNGGGGDDSEFVRRFGQWMRHHQTHHQIYNNVGKHHLDQYPNAKVAYEQEFGV